MECIDRSIRTQLHCGKGNAVCDASSDGETAETKAGRVSRQLLHA